MGSSPLRSPGPGWPAALLAAGAILGVYVFSAGRATLWDRDEPRFARATAEMMASGNYLYTTFNGELRPDKPIGVYWLMSLAVRVLGPTELAFRFFSAVGAAASCLLTWHIGRRLFGGRAGMWAMLVLASSPLVLVEGGLATADASTLPFLLGALACFAASLSGGVRLRHLAAMAGATGLAMLIKGPLGLLPLLAIGAAIFLGRRDLVLGRRYVAYSALATLCGAGIFCAWALPADAATGGELLRLGIGRHVLERMSRPLEEHGGSFLAYLPYYVPVVLIGFFPWVLHLPGAISAAIGGRLGGRRGRAFLLGATVPTFVLMSVLATKLPHYVLFVWPGMALAVGASIQAWQDGVLSERDLRWLGRGAWFLCVPAVVGAIAALIGPWFLAAPDLRIGGAVVGVVLLGMAFLAVRYHRRRGPRASAAVLLGGMLAVQLAVGVLVVPAVERVKSVPGLARRIASATPPGTPVATYDFGEPSLNFYVAREVRTLGSDPRGVLEWLRQPGDGVLVLTGEALRALRAGGSPVPGEVLARARGLNYTRKMQWYELIALRRGRAAPGAGGAPE